MEKIGFIGAGKVGNALAKYLYQNHHTISGIYSTNKRSANELAQCVHAKSHMNLLSLVKETNFLFITTPDDVIASVSEEIARLPLNLSGKIICHCSGALSSHILIECQQKSAITASIHPLQAFTGSEQDKQQLKNTFFTVEAFNQKDPVIQQLLTSLGNPFKWIDSDKKGLYHGAAVLTSNYMVTLIEEALSYMRQLDIDDKTSIEMMMPLMKSTLVNVFDKGTTDGLTGPIVRGDSGVVATHLSQINKYLDNEAVDFYKIMGRHTLKMIQNRRIDQDTYETFDALFKER